MISTVCKIPVYGCEMMMLLWPCPKHFELFHRPHRTRKVINQTEIFQLWLHYVPIETVSRAQNPTYLFVHDRLYCQWTHRTLPSPVLADP